MSPTVRRIVTALLLVVGVQVWLVWGRGVYGRPGQLRLVALAAVLALVPYTRRPIARLLDRIRHPSPRARRITTIAVAVLSTAYLVWTARYQGRDFQPRMQDEFSHLLQIRMLQEGRLWMPRHELGDFFDAFQVIIEPVYASIYFPGTSLMLLPPVLVGFPAWVGVICASGAVVGLVYRVVTELVDGVGGALAVLFVLGAELFRRLSVAVFGVAPVMLLGLLVVWAWLRWRRGRGFGLGWGLAIGAFAGWAAIVRPVDALVYAVPVGVAMLADLRGAPRRAWLRAATGLLVGAAPLLAVQVVFNVGVTGQWWRTPWEHYADRDFPRTTLGFHEYDPSVRPVSQLPQKQAFHDEFTAPAQRAHRPERIVETWLTARFPTLVQLTVPHRLCLVLLPLGLFALVRAGPARIPLWGPLAVFVGLYGMFVFFLPHYVAPLLPTMAAATVAAVRAPGRAWPRWREGTGVFLTAAVALLSLSQLPEFNRLADDEWFRVTDLPQVRERLATIPPTERAIVLFRFAPGANPHEEPVYNVEAAWPDDNRVIRAHDLGPERNRELFRYFADRQPDRRVYRYDRGDATLVYLGTVDDLAAAAATTSPSSTGSP